MKYTCQGLDLVELRALWAALPDKVIDPLR